MAEETDNKSLKDPDRLANVFVWLTFVPPLVVLVYLLVKDKQASLPWYFLILAVILSVIFIGFAFRYTRKAERLEDETKYVITKWRIEAIKAAGATANSNIFADVICLFTELLEDSPKEFNKEEIMSKLEDAFGEVRKEEVKEVVLKYTRLSKTSTQKSDVEQPAGELTKVDQ